jgi:hypothetical protein
LFDSHATNRHGVTDGDGFAGVVFSDDVHELCQHLSILHSGQEFEISGVDITPDRIIRNENNVEVHNHNQET